jgi:hypothetical protein
LKSATIQMKPFKTDNMKSIFQLVVLFFILSSINYGVFGQQKNEDLFKRLNGIKNQEFCFYNIDGYEISSLKMSGKFTAKNISKKYKKLKVKENELIHSDSSIDLQNYYVHKSENVQEDIVHHSSYYFLKTQENEISAVTFNSYNEVDIDFQRQFVRLVLDAMIPDNIYSSITTDSVNFGGRKLYLGGRCRWMNINNIQCSGYGQINWSVCKDKETSERTLETQLKVNLAHSHGKVVSEEIVDVIFEEVDTKARKVVYDFTGITSALVGMTGGKTLTIYFISAPVRDNYISCVMSFWNNDRINPSGLAPLLEEVMKLK